MDVIVNITRDDYWHFNKMFMRHYMKTQMIFFAIMVGVGLLLAIVLSALSLFQVIVGLCVFLLLFFLFLIKEIKKLPSEKSGMLGEHLIRITEDGIHEKTAVSEGWHKWSAVTDVLQDNDYLFLFVDKMQAHIIPKRAFANPNEADEFFQKSMELWKSQPS